MSDNIGITAEDRKRCSELQQAYHKKAEALARRSGSELMAIFAATGTGTDGKVDVILDDEGFDLNKLRIGIAAVTRAYAQQQGWSKKATERFVRNVFGRRKSTLSDEPQDNTERKERGHGDS